jgi:hypothetical protein
MRPTRGVKIARGCPTPADRVVQFGARSGVESGILSASNQNHITWQQGCRMPMTRGVKVTRSRPGPGRRVVEFCAAGSKAAAALRPADHPS